MCPVPEALLTGLFILLVDTLYTSFLHSQGLIPLLLERLLSVTWRMKPEFQLHLCVQGCSDYRYWAYLRISLGTTMFSARMERLRRKKFSFLLCRSNLDELQKGHSFSLQIITFIKSQALLFLPSYILRARLEVIQAA